MSHFGRLAASPGGAFIILALAAYLEVQGDACFQSALYHSAGMKQVGWFTAGTVVLVCYSLFLNSSKIDFGKLLGIYVILFFSWPRSSQSCSFISHPAGLYTSVRPWLWLVA